MSALLLLLLLLPVLGLALMQHSAVALQSSYGSVARQHWYRTTVATFLSYRNSQMASRTAHDKNSPVALQQHRIYGHSISAHSSLLDNGSPERVDPAERGSGLLAKVTAKLRSWKESIRTGIRSTAGVLANSTANTTISNAHPSFRRLIASTLQVLVLVLAISKGSTASVGFTPKPADPAAIADSAPPLQRIGIWLVLFLLSATMHSAESAITKISPWKVQEFADEEGPKSPFATLSKNLTSLLITILITTTACSIYSTAMFIAAVSELFPKLSLGFVTAALTVITLFFGELLPKALAVSNSELVARKFVPIISRLSQLLLPLTTTITYLSNLILQLAGLRSVEERNVSEDMLRMVVEEAQRTASIESGEGKMIKAVLDMQKKDVSKIMQPRVEIVALPETAVATEILQTAVRTNYSRIPVYRGDVDNIVGVIFTKDLLDYMNLPVEDVAATISELQSFRPQMKEDWSSLLASDLMKPTYFIPEGMSCSNALQELKKRRVHMAIVVDEYGGTAGLVTFEDILEEVVGEIYDEDDDEDQAYDYQTIYQRENGFYELKGYAELDDVYEALGKYLCYSLYFLFAEVFPTF